jgi:hypothetical protein
MTHTIETLKELVEQRFAALDKAARVLAAEEIARRLEILNHYHELAREKERAILSMRPIFQKSRLRRRASPAWSRPSIS